MLTFTAVPGIPEILAGQSLADVLVTALDQYGRKLVENDVVVFCQKVVSKSERRLFALADIEPGARALEISAICEKDPRLVELVLRESTEVVRCVKDVLIVRHRLGFVVANAAIDQSNVAGDGQNALLLPEDPDASAARLRQDIYERLGVSVAVLISDSFGRPWRLGVCGVCIGCAGMQPLLDKRGLTDRFGRKLEVTQIAVADEIVAAATLVMGEADEGQPVVIVSGVPAIYFSADKPASSLVRQLDEDLFK
ncbi:MAG: coenzyme F420-0:L-glutamate ligase [Georgfuchsia sp.]